MYIALLFISRQLVSRKVPPLFNRILETITDDLGDEQGVHEDPGVHRDGGSRARPRRVHQEVQHSKGRGVKKYNIHNVWVEKYNIHKVGVKKYNIHKVRVKKINIQKVGSRSTTFTR